MRSLRFISKASSSSVDMVSVSSMAAAVSAARRRGAMVAMAFVSVEESDGVEVGVNGLCENDINAVIKCRERE